jgi:hypothetical protein
MLLTLPLLVLLLYFFNSLGERLQVTLGYATTKQNETEAAADGQARKRHSHMPHNVTSAEVESRSGKGVRGVREEEEKTLA